jgi:CTP:molybdopterin cytidylyltransferase MocA
MPPYVVLHTVDTPDVGADTVRRVLDAARFVGVGACPRPLR